MWPLKHYAGYEPQVTMLVVYNPMSLVLFQFVRPSSFFRMALIRDQELPTQGGEFPYTCMLNKLPSMSLSSADMPGCHALGEARPVL